MRPVYYKVFDQGRYMGTYTATELQTMLHCGRQVPREYAAPAGDTEDAITSFWLTIPRD